MRRVGLGHSVAGLGSVMSWKMDPRATLYSDRFHYQCMENLKLCCSVWHAYAIKIYLFTAEF